MRCLGLGDWAWFGRDSILRDGITRQSYSMLLLTASPGAWRSNLLFAPPDATKTSTQPDIVRRLGREHAETQAGKYAGPEHPALDGLPDRVYPVRRHRVDPASRRRPRACR